MVDEPQMLQFQRLWFVSEFPKQGQAFGIGWPGQHNVLIALTED